VRPHPGRHRILDRRSSILVLDRDRRRVVDRRGFAASGELARQRRIARFDARALASSAIARGCNVAYRAPRALMLPVHAIDLATRGIRSQACSSIAVVQ
jgi:hypothetical protein